MAEEGEEGREELGGKAPIAELKEVGIGDGRDEEETVVEAVKIYHNSV